AIVKVLKDEGYIADFRLDADSGKPRLTIGLKYYEGRPVIDRLERVGRPGLRIYRGKDELPKVLGGMGTVIVSTPKGVMTDKQARASGQGGAALCIVASEPVKRSTMARIAKAPVELPQGVTATIAASQVTIKGAKGSLSLPLHQGVAVVEKEKKLEISFDAPGAPRTLAGATRAHLANMVRGVTKGYEKKLELVGVGFRATVQGKALNLTLGFSHPVSVPIPDGIAIETPSQTE